MKSSSVNIQVHIYLSEYDGSLVSEKKSSHPLKMNCGWVVSPKKVQNGLSLKIFLPWIWNVPIWETTTGVLTTRDQKSGSVNIFMAFIIYLICSMKEFHKSLIIMGLWLQATPTKKNYRKNLKKEKLGKLQ